MADATWTRWNRLQQLTVTRTTASVLGASGSTLTSLPFGWKNSVYVGVGADFHVSDTLKLRLGVGHDPAVSNDAARTPRLPDQARTTATLGLGAQVWSRGTLDLAYIHDFVQNASVDNGIPGVPGRLVGYFRVDANALSLQYNQKL